MKQSTYSHREAEAKWQKTWERERLNVTDVTGAKKPFYNLMMFPYPSAEGLHVGNMYAFTGSDIYGRFKRMQGYDVFEPIGLDGFGIHSENYALKIGRHPLDHAKTTEKNFYNQLHKIGAMFDWDRTVETYNPDYYRWTQWLFVQMFKHGLAYRGRANVNWCPSCKTVLADEQVINGTCERCGSLVELRLLAQWFFRITAYAEKLLQNSFKLDWSQKVKIAQQNWIGKSEGVTFRFKVKDLNMYFDMFDSVPQTYMAQTFTVIAPEHPKAYELVKGTKYEKPVMEFVERIKKKKAAKRFDAEKEVEGVFTGRYLDYAPAKRLLPIWVASFVVFEYGTGVVNSSAHDERDFEFAKKYHLPLHPVMVPKDPVEAEKVRNLEYCYHHEPEGVLTEPQEFKGRKWGEARNDIIAFIEKHGWGKRTAQYHLRDWLISRQRYWGPPIPMIHCDACEKAKKGERPEMPGWWSVPEDQLPVKLPRIEDYRPGADGVAPLAKHKEFYQTTCPGCGGKATRETDVSDTFLDSSWYFLRYPSTRSARSGQVPFDKEITKKWLPVAMYTGGAEHSVLHLMYSRFVTMALKDWGYINFEEPFTRFYAHGLVIREGAKMSKSKGNIVNPDEYIALCGADALRMYLMFMGPFDLGGDFRDAAMEGMGRWVGRVWRIGGTLISKSDKYYKSDKSITIHNALQKLIKKVTEDTEKRRYNTAIASMMEFTNLVSDENGAISRDDFKTFLYLLAPYAPYLSEELYQRLRGTDEKNYKASDSIHRQKWPSYDLTGIKEEFVVVAVQVNGKLRDTLTISAEKSKNQKDVEEAAKASENVKRHIADKKIVKVIFVAGKLMNFVAT